MGLIRVGKDSIISIVSESHIRVLITFIWSCTNSLVPKTNGYCYPLKVKKPCIYTWKHELAVLACFFGK